MWGDFKVWESVTYDIVHVSNRGCYYFHEDKMRK